MSKSEKKPFANYRNNFFDLSDVYGVDLENGTFTPDPRFANCKTFLREEVLESLELCEGPEQYPDLLIFQTDDGRIHMLDGFHRITNSLKRYKENAEKWKRFPYELFRGTEDAARFESVRRNLDPSGTRGYLTPQEEAAPILYWIDNGYTVEQILKNLGRSPQNVTWVNKIADIRSKGIYAVEEAVMSNKIDPTTAAKISRAPVEEQRARLDSAITAVAEGKSVVEVREAAGVKKEIKKSMNQKEILDYLFTFYDEGFASAYEAEQIDDNLIGQVMALTSVLYIDGPMMERFEVLDDFFLKRKEAEQKAINSTRSKPIPVQRVSKPKRNMKAAWQV